VLEVAKDINGREILAAYAPILPLDWIMLVELPIEEANALPQ
jgi:hypothetical protein